MNRLKLVLPIIVISQFCCTSLWFAGNTVMSDLVSNFGMQAGDLAHLTSAVQFGFIAGTLVFAVLTIADRYSPSRVFLISALLGALFNLGVIWEGNSFGSLLTLRFFTGFFLAGIYPVGMKIAADYFEKGLGKSLGFLVGALVLGTAFPHLLKGLTADLPWKSVLIATSSFAVFGGVLMGTTVADGPHRKPGQGMDFSRFLHAFRNPGFRSATFGYFGHMWELYAFWAFIPVMLTAYQALHPEARFNIPVMSFLIIGVGGLACVLGGYLSQSWGTKRVATLALTLSGVCCLLSPFVFAVDLPLVFIAFLLFWGMVVVADSPLFSTLVAQNANPEFKGTALTMVNCIGFSVTIVSIQLVSLLADLTDSNGIYAVLAVGPALGLLALWGKTSSD